MSSKSAKLSRSRSRSAKIHRISFDETKKNPKLAYAKSVMYESTVGALKKGQVPILDPLIIRPAYLLYKRAQGVSRKEVEARIASDNEKIQNFTRKMKHSLFSKKGGRKSRKNRSRKHH